MAVECVCLPICSYTVGGNGQKSPLDLYTTVFKTLEAKDGIEKKDMGREKLCVLMGPVGAERAFERHRMPSFPAFYFLLAFAVPATYWTLSP
jgi:hypothetical protein